MWEGGGAKREGAAAARRGAYSWKLPGWRVTWGPQGREGGRYGRHAADGAMACYASLSLGPRLVSRLALRGLWRAWTSWHRKRNRRGACLPVQHWNRGIE